MELWRRVLKLENSPSLHDNFFELGGDSLASSEVIFAIDEKFSCDLALETLFECPTIATLDASIEQHMKSCQSISIVQSPRGSSGSVRQLRSFSESPVDSPNSSAGSTTRPLFEVLKLSAKAAGWPLYCMPMSSGYVDEYLDLARIIGQDRPVYGITWRANNWKTFESHQELAASATAKLLDAPSKGPIYLLGYSFAGRIAVETARQLAEHGVTVPFVAIVDGVPSSYSFSLGTRIRHFAKAFGPWAFRVATRYATDATQRLNYHNAIRHKLNYRRKGQPMIESQRWYQSLPESHKDFVAQNLANSRKYRFEGIYRGRIVLLRTLRGMPVDRHPFHPWRRLEDYGWGQITGTAVDVVHVPGDHDSIVRHPDVVHLANAVRQALNDCDRNFARSVSPAPA